MNSDQESAALVPPTAIGRMLDQDEAAELIRRLERGIPKRPAAASVRRVVKRKRKSPGMELRGSSRREAVAGGLWASPSADSTDAHFGGSVQGKIFRLDATLRGVDMGIKSRIELPDARPRSPRQALLLNLMVHDMVLHRILREC